MVRVNLISPGKLADQHLIAEYAEILMLADYIKKHPELEGIPSKYCLGTGHQKFFKNKLMYLKKRHESLKKEMRKRGFHPKRSLSLKGFPKANLHGWKPKEKDFKIIKKRIAEKIRKKPDFYRYCGKKMHARHHIKRIM